MENAVSELLHPEHGTFYCYISVRQPSSDNSSSLGSKLISLNAPTYDFYLRELLRSELTYLTSIGTDRMSLLVVTINDLRRCMRPDPSCSAVQIGCGNCQLGCRVSVRPVASPRADQQAPDEPRSTDLYSHRLWVAHAGPTQ